MEKLVDQGKAKLIGECMLRETENRHQKENSVAMSKSTDNVLRGI